MRSAQTRRVVQSSHEAGADYAVGSRGCRVLNRTQADGPTSASPDAVLPGRGLVQGSRDPGTLGVWSQPLMY